MALAVLGLAALVTVASGRLAGSDRRYALLGSLNLQSTAIPIVGEARGYPPGWRTSISEVERNAAFAVMLPRHPLANRQNVTDVFMDPDGKTVALDFPTPVPPSQGQLRQPFLEIFETPWIGGDPAADFAQDVASDPVVGKRLYEVNGEAALGVDAHSPSDQEQANPAFLKFVHQGIEIQLSGGESVQRLVEIAESMTRM